MIRCLKIRLRFYIEPDKDVFYAYCPELKGVHVDGKTPEEALENVRTAAHAYIESLLINNDPLPLCIEDMPLSVAIGRAFSSLFPQRSSTVRIEDIEVAVPA
ncbi:MAG: type II toxin-antitoxin system HicB family antitoxin [Proteobacteria bacterium]|nr:type II toxin-antitoxin system HicB family antitoxin [Pseudomonadota bacterium]